MMKKALALAGAGAMLLAVVGPTFGFWWGGNEVEIDNHAKVYTKVYTTADSGDNEIGGKMVFGGKIVTGAATAGSEVYNDVNSSVLGCKDCSGSVEIDNHARVYTKVYTKADSGDNEIGGKIVGGGKIITGAAGAGSLVTNIVNFTMVGVPTEED